MKGCVLIIAICIIADYDNVTNEGDSVYVENGKAKKQLYVYPAMWTKANSIIPKDSFAVSDMEIKYALSKVYLRLMKELEDGSTNTSEPATPFSEIEIRKKEGVDLASLDFLGIWDYLKEDVETDRDANIVTSIQNTMESGRVYEKPVYNASLIDVCIFFLH